MNDTLSTVLITIVAVQTVNFILLALDEAFGWKYEDWAKRICCLVPWLIITLFLAPRLIYVAVKKWRHPAPKYALYRVRSDEAYHARVFIGKSKTYQDAVDMMNEDVESLNEQTGTNFKLDINNRDCSYIFKDDDDGSVIMYEIVKR